MAKNKNLHKAKAEKNDEFTQEILNKYFTYSEGTLYWKKSNTIAGGVNAVGYVTVGFKGKRHLAHRIIYTMLHGNIAPNKSIDHIDGDKKNNRIDNLREVSHQQNLFNQVRAKGYSWNKKLEKYSAQIHVKGVKKHLGYFSSEGAARDAYLEAKSALHLID